MTAARTLRRAGALVCAVLLAGCGVRTTSVPVDAGPAPSRLRCDVDRKNAITQTAPGGVPVRVYLVCASELESVERVAALAPAGGAGDRLRLAQALLDELQAQPPASEHEAGFTTYVPSPLLVSRGRRGDPAGTLRLSRQPEDLPPAALAQITCTLAEGGAVPGDEGRVVLAGPGAYPARSYTCDHAVKSDPDATSPSAAPAPASPSPARS